MTHRADDSAVRERQVDEIIAAYLAAVDAGQASDRREWLARYPEFAAELRVFFADHDQVDQMASPLRPVPQGAPAAIETVSVAPGGTVSEQQPAPRRRFGDYELLE